jgi:hypothetical protein
MQNAQGTGIGSPPGEPSAGGIVSQAKEGASVLVEGAKAQALGAVEDKKATAADTLGTVAGVLREAAQKLEGEAGPLGSYASGAAEQVDKVARYIREKDVEGLTRDAETFARRHPEVFLGGAFLAGLLAARFLKSSAPRPAMSGGEGGGSPQGYQGGYGSGYESRSYAGSYASDVGTGTQPFNPPHFDPAGGH